MGTTSQTDQLAALILSESADHDRFLVAIAGPPGSGKSTLAAALCQQLQASATTVLVPMDGFHLDDSILLDRGQRAEKGAPHTFDADGFLALCQRLDAGVQDVYFPIFDRNSESSRAGAGCVRKTDKLVILEGNYLLLNEPPWHDLAALFDLTVYLDVNEAVLLERLRRRWLDHGLSVTEAVERAQGNDLGNGRLVARSSTTADLVLSL